MLDEDAGLLIITSQSRWRDANPDIIERFHHLDQEADRQRTEQSFLVPKQEIADNDYDLSINKYKKTEYKPVEYPPTSEIMAELRRLEKEVNTAMDELEQMLK